MNILNVIQVKSHEQKTLFDAHMHTTHSGIHWLAFEKCLTSSILCCSEMSV